MPFCLTFNTKYKVKWLQVLGASTFLAQTEFRCQIYLIFQVLEANNLNCVNEPLLSLDMNFLAQLKWAWSKILSGWKESGRFINTTLQKHSSTAE